MCWVTLLRIGSPSGLAPRTTSAGRRTAVGLDDRLLSDSGGGGGQPALCPVGDCRQDRLESTAPRSQPVAHSHGRARVNETFDKPFGLELAEPLGEDAVAYAGNAGQKLIESSRRWDQGFDDRPGPTLPYQLNGALKGRAVVEAPTDHGERFYALSVVSETIGLRYFLDSHDRPLGYYARKQAAAQVVHRGRKPSRRRLASVEDAIDIAQSGSS